MVRHAGFSPDGRQVVTASGDRTARVWDAASGREVAVLQGHRESVTHAGFSPDGRWVVTTSSDGTARIYVTRFDDLLQLAEERLAANLTADERKDLLRR